MDINLYKIMKAKLARGGNMNGGEIKLIVTELVSLIESQTEKINELEEAINALSRGGNRGPRKSSSKAEVQSDSDE